MNVISSVFVCESCVIYQNVRLEMTSTIKYPNPNPNPNPNLGLSQLKVNLTRVRVKFPREISQFFANIYSKKVNFSCFV